MLPSIRSKSPPAEKTLPPAPWMITQLTVSSASMSRQTLTSSVCMIESVALYFSGRFMVTRSTLGCGRSNSRRWYLFCQSDMGFLRWEASLHRRLAPSIADVLRAGEAHGFFRRADKGARLQVALLELGLEVGIGHDADARLHMHDVVLHEGGAQQDAGVHRAVGGEVAGAA